MVVSVGFEFLSTGSGVFVDDLPYADELLVPLVAHDVPVILDTTAPPDPLRPSFGPGSVSWIRGPASPAGRGVVAQVTDERETDGHRVVIRYSDRRPMGHEPWELRDDTEMVRSETDRTGAILSHDAEGAQRRVILPTPDAIVPSLRHLPHGDEIADRLARPWCSRARSQVATDSATPVADDARQVRDEPSLRRQCHARA